jgi:hypothetical protein
MANFNDQRLDLPVLLTRHDIIQILPRQTEVIEARLQDLFGYTRVTMRFKRLTRYSAEFFMQLPGSQTRNLFRCHPNLARALFVAARPDHLVIVSEYCDYELLQLASFPHPEPIATRFNIRLITDLPRQAMSALLFLHETSHLHGGLKTTKILLQVCGNRLVLKLSDHLLVQRFDPNDAASVAPRNAETAQLGACLREVFVAFYDLLDPASLSFLRLHHVDGLIGLMIAAAPMRLNYLPILNCHPAVQGDCFLWHFICAVADELFMESSRNSRRLSMAVYKYAADNGHIADYDHWGHRMIDGQHDFSHWAITTSIFTDAHSPVWTARVMRNKGIHFLTAIAPHQRHLFEPFPTQYMFFWLSRFPHLVDDLWVPISVDPNLRVRFQCFFPEGAAYIDAAL